MTTLYTHLLLATDLSDDNTPVIEKARALADLHNAKLSAIHVVENIPIYFGNEMVLTETQAIEVNLVEHAERRMAEIAKRFGIPSDNCTVETGVTKHALLDYAAEHKVDLIVIGSHSRHGLGHLLGSTARAVLNDSPCDVLAVKV